jgi:hypothetical protein
VTASALAVLMSQTVLAGVDVHVSVPTIHISVPTVHVSAPIVQVQAPILIKTAKTKGTPINSSALHRDHQDSGSDRWGHNTPVVIATNRGTPVGVAVHSTTYVPPGRDLPKGGRNGGSQTTSKGVSVVTLDIPGTSGRNWPRSGGNGGGSGSGITVSGTTVPGNNVPPPGVYNPNCDGAADCGIVTQPTQAKGPLGTVPPFPNLAGETCVMSTHNGEVTDDITITAETVLGPGNIAISVDLNGTGMGPHPNLGGSMTENPDGTYTVTFQWTDAQGTTVTFFGSLKWTPGPNGGSWTLVATSSTGQVGHYLGCTFAA